jgi:3',5'-cyclic AMP phosphodiesterase CpdA
VSAEDKKRVLVIAGDLCSIQQGGLLKDTLSFFSKHFKYVLLSLGNHEYNFAALNDVPQQMSELIKSLHVDNLFLLHKNYFLREEILVIGATLWSDLTLSKHQLERTCHVKHDPLFSNSLQKLTAKERYLVMNCLHQEQKEWLFKVLRKYQGMVKRTMVVTHHAPSFHSINPIFKGRNNHFLYASDLNNDIKRLSPNVWIHGHTHSFCDYYIGNTHILANPFGFPGEETGFRHKCLLRL